MGGLTRSRGWRLAVLLLAAVLLTGSCREPDALVFAVGGAPDELAVWEDVARDFHRQTGIAVRLLRQPSGTDQRRQSLVIALSSGAPEPDVMMMDVGWIGLLAASGWLVPLDGRVDTSPYFQHILNAADTHAGRLVALPMYMDGGLLYYRKDLLERFGLPGPPQTWDQLREYALRVQAELRHEQPRFYGFVWQGAQYEGLVCNFIEFAGAEGGFVRDGERLQVDTPVNAAAAGFMQRLIVDGISPPSTYTEMHEEEARAVFYAGGALFERNWPYAWALHETADSPVRNRVGVAPLPGPTPGTAVSALGGWHIGISAHTRRPAAALALLRFVSSAEVQKRMALRLGWNPGRMDLYADPDIVRTTPHLPALQEVFRRAVLRPSVPYYHQVSAGLQRNLNAVLAGTLTPEEGLRRAQAEIDAVTKRYRPEGRP